MVAQTAAELAEGNPIKEADPLSGKRIEHIFEGDIL